MNRLYRIPLLLWLWNLLLCIAPIIFPVYVSVEGFQCIYFFDKRFTKSISKLNGVVELPIKSQHSNTIGIQQDDEQQKQQHQLVSIYVHIPFCRRRCRYCDFAIVPIGSKNELEDIDINLRTTSQDDMSREYDSGLIGMIQNYTMSVQSEILQESTKLLQKNKKLLVRSIYFGGGTPSLAPTSMLQSILNDITKKDDSPFILTDDVEISIEIDPGTFTIEKLFHIKDIGFNRISLGVQSFDDEILESIGRVHRKIDIDNSLRMIKTVFGSNINLSIDLISGLPGLSLAKWTETLNTAINLDPIPRHLSLYDLQIESGTVFGKWYGDNDDDNPQSFRQESTNMLINTGRYHPTLPTAEMSAYMYKYAAGYLQKKGFEHYEVSSYARKKYSDSDIDNTTQRTKSNRSIHNQNYWAVDGQWYAFGLGSTSYLNGELLARPRALSDYNTWVVERSKANVDLIVSDTTKLVPDLDKLMDIVLKRLRTSEGLSLEWIRQQYSSAQLDSVGEMYVAAILHGAQLGIELNLAHFDEQQQVLRLTDPNGFMFSNSIISSIFLSMETCSTEQSS